MSTIEDLGTAPPKNGKTRRPTVDDLGRPSPSGFASYDEYIHSDLWVQRREQYYQTHPKKCAVRGCGTTERIHLHHRTYERGWLGQELDDDLVPLCEDHHAAVHERHELIKQHALKAATEHIIAGRKNSFGYDELLGPPREPTETKTCTCIETLLRRHLDDLRVVVVPSTGDGWITAIEINVGCLEHAAAEMYNTARDLSHGIGAFVPVHWYRPKKSR